MKQPPQDVGKAVSVDAFRLDGLCVDPGSGRIEGPGGCEQVDPKVMEVLTVLVADSGRVVTRARLMDRVWCDRVVTEDAISRCIYQLRRHLVRAGGEKRYRRLIETLPRRGYRLRIQPEPLSEREPAIATQQPRPARPLLLFLLLLVVAVAWWLSPWERYAESGKPFAAREVSIAVLPFTDLSATGDKGYLADGITEELINVLSRIPDLRVIARTSSFSFKGQSPDIARVARTLNVSHVLEGSVRSSGNRIRVTAQLIDAADSSHLWSRSFERELGDVFMIQDDIAGAVAAALEIRLVGNDSSRPASPVDPRAWARNQEARYLLHRREVGDLARSEALFREAVQLDSDLVDAWAGLAGVYFIMAAEGEMPEAEAMDRMRIAAERAIELDPDHPEAYSRLANWHLYRKDFETARQLFERAVARGHNNVLILGNRAGRAMRRGDLAHAIALTREALTLDPLSALNRHNLSLLLVQDGRLAEAHRLVEESLQLLQGERSRKNFYDILGRIHILEGDPGAALSVARQMGDSVGAEWLRAMAEVASTGRLRDGTALRLQQLPMEALELRMAELYALADQPDRAFEWLGRGATLRKNKFLASRIFISNVRSSPFLTSLYADPRWTQWLKSFDVHELPG